jgi:hypothetical protein
MALECFGKKVKAIKYPGRKEGEDSRMFWKERRRRLYNVLEGRKENTLGCSERKEKTLEHTGRNKKALECSRRKEKTVECSGRKEKNL